MTAKRFTSSTYQDALSGVYDGKENLTVNECCNLLNELHEENENLKQANSQLAKVNREGVKKVQKLAKENEQLRHDATILIQSNQDYRKENEQLKKQLRYCEKFRHTVFQEISKEMSKHD